MLDVFHFYVCVWVWGKAQTTRKVFQKCVGEYEMIFGWGVRNIFGILRFYPYPWRWNYSTILIPGITIHIFQNNLVYKMLSQNIQYMHCRIYYLEEIYSLQLYVYTICSKMQCVFFKVYSVLPKSIYSIIVKNGL